MSNLGILVQGDVRHEQDGCRRYRRVCPSGNRPHAANSAEIHARFGIGAPRPNRRGEGKLDVDSIEEKIIRGGHRTFGAARSVMVEAFSSAREPLLGAARALEELGFVPDHEFNAGNLHNYLFVNTRKF